jgi:TetR/AcrR family transcriptional regulator, cholesterol catabolism regulator
MPEPIRTADILRVAAEEFSKKGYRGARLSDVADSLGVTRQALYYYYKSKAAILVDLFSNFFDDLEAGLDAVEAGGGSAAEDFDAMMRAHIRTVAARPELSAIFTQERSALPPTDARRIQRRRQAYQQRLVEAYEKGIKEGGLRDCGSSSVEVSLILGAANWIFRWYRPGRDLTPEALADIAVNLLGSGYRLAPDRKPD